MRRVLRNSPKTGHDPSRINRATGSFDRSQVEVGRVGYTTDQAEWPEDTPAWIRWQDGEPIVEVQTRPGDKITARIGVPSTESIGYGQQVILVYPDGDPSLAVIVGVLRDSRFPAPERVCEIETGIADASPGATLPAATWSFTRLPDGRALAFQTQGADVLVWSGGSIHLRCSSSAAIHLDGRVALGARPLKGPTGSEVAPGGEEIPGIVATPFEAIPHVPPSPVAPGPLPAYQGSADGIVRAKELYASTAAVDPSWWSWVSGVDAVARGVNPALAPLPLSLASAITGASGPGSRHTAGD